MGEAVLNGIAYDAAGDRLWVTGKLWPRVFRVALYDPAPPPPLQSSPPTPPPVLVAAADDGEPAGRAGRAEVWMGIATGAWAGAVRRGLDAGLLDRRGGRPATSGGAR